MGSCEYLLCSWLVRITPGPSLVCFCLGTFVQTAAHALKALHLLYSPEHPICLPAQTLRPPPAQRGPLPRTLPGALELPCTPGGTSASGAETDLGSELGLFLARRVLLEGEEVSRNARAVE